MLPIVDKQTLEANAQDGDWGSAWLEQGNVAGTGPYKFSTYSKSGTTELEAHPDYWRGWEDDQFGQVDIEIIPEASTTMQTLRIGEADIFGGTFSKDNWNQVSTFENVSVPEDTQKRLFMSHFNTTKEPLDDINVRKAIFHSVDFQSVVDNILGGGQVAAGPVPRPMSEFHNSDVPVSTRDEGMANDALSNASYSLEEINAAGIEIWPMAGNPVFEQTALLISDSVQETVGIEIAVKQTPWTGIADAYQTAETSPHMFLTYNSAKFPSVFTHTNFMFHPDNFGSYANAHFWRNEDLIALLEEAQTTADRQERIQLYKEAQMMAYEGYPIIPIANPVNRCALNKNVGGYVYNTIVDEEDAYRLRRTGDGRAK